jgi:nitrogen fixation protein NifU and related proteins
MEPVMEDDGLSELIKSIERETREGYSEAVLDHAMNPRNLGKPEESNGDARFEGPCGDTIAIWINVSGDRIEKANFWTDGCGTSIACGSMVTELATGKTLEQAGMIGKRDVLDALGGLSADTEHCALLAATALKLAIKDYREKQGRNG